MASHEPGHPPGFPIAHMQGNGDPVRLPLGALVPPGVTRLRMVFADYVTFDESPYRRYVLPFRDGATGHTIVFGPFTSADGKHCANSLLQYAATLGPPTFLRVDRAAHNMNVDVTTMCERLGTSLDPISAPYNPQSLGVAERVNKELNRVLRQLLLDLLAAGATWPDSLFNAVYQFNHTPGANLGFHSAAAYVTGIILPDVLQSALHIRPAQPDTNSSPLSALDLRHEQRAASLSRLNAPPDRQDPASINIGDYAFIQRRSRRSNSRLPESAG